MDIAQIFGTECDGIWSGNIKVDGKKGVGENCVRLHTMGFQIRLLHAMIFDIKRARFRKTKNRMRDQSNEI